MNYQKSEQLTMLEPSMDEEPIGSYGRDWIKFMESNYPKLVKQMKRQHIFLTVARSVDERAWDYRFVLDEQYAKANPRPKGYEETVAWEKMRTFHTDGAVMREIVLIPITKP